MTNFKRSIRSAVAPLAMLVALAGCSTYEQAVQTSAAAVVDDAVPTASLERVANDGPALWKVTDEDTTIYMFGTIHILPKDIPWQTATIQEALNSSDVLVTEIPTGSGKSPEEQAFMMQRGMLGEGNGTLRALLTDEQTAIYEAALGKLGMPAATFDPMKPWMAAVTFSILPLINAGYDPSAGVEEVLEGLAGEAKARGALETLEYQLDVFDKMPQDSQIRYLVETAAEVDNMVTTLDEMVAEWVEGDADQLAVLMNEGLTDPVLAERLLYTRNKNWAEWIDARLDTPGTVFMAVGAGHLAGEKSVQDYLINMDIAEQR